MPARSAAPSRPSEPSLTALFDEMHVRIPKDSVGFLLWQITHAWQRYMDEILKPLDLTHLQFVILVTLAWLSHEYGSEGVTRTRIARFSTIHPMQVSQVVKMLERKGLIVQTPSPADTRSKPIAPLACGIALLRRAVPLVEAANQDFFNARLGDPEPLRSQLQRLIERCPRSAAGAV